MRATKDGLLTLAAQLVDTSRAASC